MPAVLLSRGDHASEHFSPSAPFDHPRHAFPARSPPWERGNSVPPYYTRDATARRSPPSAPTGTSSAFSSNRLGRRPPRRDGAAVGRQGGHVPRRHVARVRILLSSRPVHRPSARAARRKTQERMVCVHVEHAAAGAPSGRVTTTRPPCLPRSNDLEADIIVAGGRHCEGRGRPAIATGGANAGARLGPPASQRRPACGPIARAAHKAPKPVVPAHLRRVLQRADVRRVRVLFARSPGLASHDADPPSGRRPARQRGRLVRIRVHFGAADDRGEGPLRESNGCLCVDLRDENDITSASFSSNIISCDRYALSMLAVVSSCRLGSDSASCVRCRA